MNVGALEHRPVVTCPPDSSLATVAAIMRDDGVGSLVVMDEHNHMVGIVTDRDVVIRGLAAGLEPGAAVEKVMTRDVSYVYENADVWAAATEMATRGIRRLPVLTAEGHVSGLLSFDDLIVTYSDEMDRLARAVRKEVMGAGP